MKRTLLSVFVFLIVSALSAQDCVPDPQYADEPFGIWPAPEDGLEVGQVGVLYSQILNFKIPSDPNELPEDLLTQFPIVPPPGTTIDSVSVTALNGLPNGLQWACNSHSSEDCTFHSDTQGCAVIYGVPTESGTFDLVIVMTIYIFNPSLGVIPFQNFEYTDYQLIVDNDVSVSELAQFGLKLDQNMPNPFTDETMIEFTLNQPQMIEFNVFNLLGKNIHSRSLNASQGVNRIEMNAGELNMAPGIYLYSMTIDGQSVTRKMIVK